MKLSNFMSTSTQTISSAIENLDFVEIYNNYALWINENRWAFKSGKQEPKKPRPLHLAKRPDGLTAFVKSHYNFKTEEDLKSFQRSASNFLTYSPEVINENADIFCKTFPALIQFKLDKKQKADSEEDKVRDANLRSHFDIAEEVQMEIPLKITTAKSTKSNSKLSEITQSICEMAKFGAKSIKSPDGWEVQF
jgi:hypothetical protein